MNAVALGVLGSILPRSGGPRAQGKDSRESRVFAVQAQDRLSDGAGIGRNRRAGPTNVFPRSDGRMTCA